MFQTMFFGMVNSLVLCQGNSKSSKRKLILSANYVEDKVLPKI